MPVKHTNKEVMLFHNISARIRHIEEQKITEDNEGNEEIQRITHKIKNRIMINSVIIMISLIGCTFYCSSSFPSFPSVKVYLCSLFLTR